MRKRTNKPGFCPAPDCSGGRPPRQNEMTSGQYNQLDDNARESIGAHAKRCSYCGCVYYTDAHGIPHIMGWLDSDILGKGWHPKGQ